jgi:hypothetical protein
MRTTGLSLVGLLLFAGQAEAAEQWTVWKVSKGKAERVGWEIEGRGMV